MLKGSYNGKLLLKCCRKISELNFAKLSQKMGYNLLQNAKMARSDGKETEGQARFRFPRDTFHLVSAASVIVKPVSRSLEIYRKQATLWLSEVASFSFALLGAFWTVPVKQTECTT